MIDFGVAKATEATRLGDLSFHTQLDQMIGTPLYMSPEQAERSGTDIDTRSDIYSLGVLLYELLTGRTPFDAEKLAQRGLDEIRRAIRERDPLTPSLCVSTMEGERRMHVARHRQAESGKWIGQLRGDLDWNVMKALEKDRVRRYETANGFALDIQRHLDSEPVLARPASHLYRLQRTVRRNRLAFAAESIVTLALLSALVVLTTSRARITREKNQKEVALQEKEAARRAEHGERQKSDAANRDLHEANTRLADTVSLLELEHAESFFHTGDAGTGVAHLAATLRRDPSNHIAASRLVSALLHRTWAIPDSPPGQHRERVVSARFSPDGQNVLSASWDRTAQIRHASFGTSIVTVRHDGAVNSARYNPDGTAFVTASADGTARIWNAKTGEPITPPLRHGGNVFDAEFSPDGESVLTASEDKTARIWDARSGELRHELGSGTPVLMAHFSPDGQLAATGTDGGSVLLWSVSSGELLSRQAVQLGRVNWLAFSPNGSRLISAHAGGRAGRRHGARLGHSLGGIGDAALATCCRSLVGALQPQWAIRRHRLERWQRARLGRRDRTAGFAAAVALDHVEWAEFSPDGERVVTASGDNKAHIWDVRTGKTIGAPLRHLRTVNRAGFSPDGRRVLTASLDRTARIWDANTGEPVTEAFQHNDGVTQACFSPDGARVLTGTWNSQARLWDAATGRPLTEWLETGRKQVTSACFDPTGQRIATGTFDQVARVWEVPPIPVPVPAWFIELAEGVAGVRLGAHGSVELIPAENVLEPMQRAKASMAEGFYDQVGRWFVTGLDVRARSVLKQGEAISESPIPNAAERR